MLMKIWTASAVSRYYLNPAIAFQALRIRGKGVSSARGYYIVPHCDPDCCQDFGGVTTADLGPFLTRIEARNWSRKYMAGNGRPAN